TSFMGVDFANFRVMHLLNRCFSIVNSLLIVASAFFAAFRSNLYLSMANALICDRRFPVKAPLSAVDDVACRSWDRGRLCPLFIPFQIFLAGFLKEYVFDARLLVRLFPPFIPPDLPINRELADSDVAFSLVAFLLRCGSRHRP